MASRKPTLLVADDDVHMLRLMRRILELEGYQVLTVTDGEATLNVFDEEVPDLVLLDIIMPKMDGYTVCQRIREFSQVPIIMVTAKNQDMDKVKGLQQGADDYVTKPFASQELVARVKTVMRRTTSMNSTTKKAVFQYSNLTVDFVQHRVSLEGEEISLTATEYKLLCYLALNAGRVVTLDLILKKVWGENYIGDSHLVQVSISRLRRKLRDDRKNPMYILTRRGIGYMMKKYDQTVASNETK